MLELDIKTSAVVLIDLQKGIMGRDLSPHTGEQVIKKAKEMAERFRRAGGTVVLVNVRWSDDFKDALRQPVDQPFSLPPGGFPPHFSEIVDGLEMPGDVRVTKRQWGAFYGTDLDLQLRRRGIQTIVLGGVATNMGVESTARQAWELGYALIIVEDVTSSVSGEMHEFSVRHIFPRIGRVVRSADLSFT